MEAKATSTPRVLGGRYRLGRVLGRGAMGEVYEAVDERLARPVAVKILRAALARDEEVRRRFADEARSAARLSHPNVVAVFDSGEDPDGTPFLVMERLPGETLADRIREGPLEAGWVLLVAGDVLGALATAHAAGIVHRDVKPGNVLIGADGCAKVADFGIAKSAEAAAGGDATATGELLGTPAYLAPERLDGHPATPRSDVYAVGVMLYEALAGRKPFDAETPVGLAYAARHATPPPLAELRPDLDPRVVEIVERAMAREEGDRFASAAAMETAVAAVAGVHPGEADQTLVGAPDRTVVVPTAAPAPRPAAVTAPARRRIPVPVVLAGLALLAALAVLTLTRSGSGGTDGAALASSMEALAERVEVGDGPRGPDLADGLRAVAGDVRAGGGGIRATDTLRELEAWHQQRLVFDTAYQEASALLRQVPGVQLPAAAPPPSAAPQSTTLPPPPEDDDGGGGDDNKGRGKGKGRGDD